jgi:hypothetical protein
MARFALAFIALALAAFTLFDAATVHAAPVAQRPAGPIDVFAVGDGGQLLHKWLNTTGGWQPSVSGFETFGSGLVGTPAALARRNGILDVFARGADGSLLHRWLPTSGSWMPFGTFETLGSGLAGDPQAFQTADGTIHVFARDTAGELVHKSAGTAGNWAVSRLQPFDVLGTGITGTPVVVQRQDGTLDVFARGPDGALLHKWLPLGGGWQPAGTAFETLGSAMAGAPAALVREDGTLDVFARGQGGGLLHKWLPLSGSWQPSATTFEVLGSGLAGDPQAIQTKNGNVNVFAHDADGALAHKWLPAGGSWLPSPFGPFETLGTGSSGRLTGRPVVIQRQAGPIDVFEGGTGGELAHKWFGDNIGWQPSQFGPFETLGPGLALTSFDVDAPAAPTGVSAAAGVRAATVSWTSSTFDGNDPILDYEVRSSPQGVDQTVAWPATSLVVSGLTEGVAYTFTVRARNDVGFGPEATSNPATPTAPPPAQTTTTTTPTTTTTATTTTTTTTTTTSPPSTTTTTGAATSTTVSTPAGTTTQSTTTTVAAPSKPKARCSVPNLRGLTLATARARVRAHHCGLARVKTRVSPKTLRGRVVAQSPRAGAVRVKGAPVTIWLGGAVTR